MDHLARPDQKIRLILLCGGVILLAVAGTFWHFCFGAPKKSAEPERFVITKGSSHSDVVKKLVDDGFIRKAWAFNLLHSEEIMAGGYWLNKGINAFQISEILKTNPYMKWITVPEGLRKEEIAKLMQETLGWSDKEVNDFITRDTVGVSDIPEGVFFPDTYLIPVDESTDEVARRLNRRWSEIFAPYGQEALDKNIKWTTVINIAALIQRETAGTSDMALISGVIWNRLDRGMKLDIDATVQYARGDLGAGYWAPLKGDKSSLDSPFNTYKYKGLPPHPIANPGVAAIRAALNPETTKCLFYLHAPSKEIYCSPTFEGHKENIEKYLTN